LRQRVAAEPAEARHHLELAAFYGAQGRARDMRLAFEHMVRCLPDDATAHFNLACCLRSEGRLDEALAEHQRALTLGIPGPEEVWSNIAVILAAQHRHDESRTALEKALSLNPDWAPAHYNLGLWFEEHGERNRAKAHYRRAQTLDPGCVEALARLAGLHRGTGMADPLIAEIRSALRRARIPAEAESLLFAQGKLLEDGGQYTEAFESYAAANRLARGRSIPYDRDRNTALFRGIRETFNTDWLNRASATSQAGKGLVFICGMFRSGTTLVEQCLAGHPDVVPAGERAFFHARLLAAGPSAFPGHWAHDAAARTALAADYLGMLTTHFPGARRITDKRPDNFLFIGLLAAMFPQAKFVHTRRDPRDTCLSIWTQQLDGYLGYATDLADIAHYHRDYCELMAHWHTIAGDRIHDVDYESLVTTPEATLRRLCGFLDLPWAEAVMKPQARRNRVRTASLWQVREAIHTGAVGRWRRYARQLAAAGIDLNEGEAADGE
jgi:tetratricopeptide (TPR) repeat protein